MRIVWEEGELCHDESRQDDGEGGVYLDDRIGQLVQLLPVAVEAEARVGSLLLLEELLAHHVLGGGLLEGLAAPDVVLIGQGQAGGQEGGQEEPGHHLVFLP